MNRFGYGNLRVGLSQPVAALKILAVALMAMACNSNHPAAKIGRTAAASTVAYEGTIVAVGDSLTAGLNVAEDLAYPARLARKLKADGYRFRVINAGVSGETSSGALARINWVLSSLKPDIVILETGANDGLQGRDPDLLKNNLDELLSRLKMRHIVVVLAGMRGLPYLGPVYTRAFDTIYPQMAEKHQAIFMPFFLESVVGRSIFNQPDKLHPNAQGYERIVEDVYPYILQAIGQYRGQN
jgi:acyl-CoA thioesterase-1